MSSTHGIRPQCLSTDVLRLVMRETPSESVLHRLNKFYDLDQSKINIPNKHIQEMKLSKEKLHARMVKPLVTLLQL